MGNKNCILHFLHFTVAYVRFSGKMTTCVRHRRDAVCNMGRTMAVVILDDLGSLKKSTLVSRNITVVGRRTSVRLEPEMWNALRDIAEREQCKIHDICSLIHLRKNQATSLTAAIRVFLMLYYRAAATEDGHQRAKHGNFDQMIQRARMTSDMLRKPAAEAEKGTVSPQGDMDEAQEAATQYG